MGGYLTTREMMKDLYKVYYSEVIPSLIHNYNAMTGRQYKRNFALPQKTLFSRFKAIFTSKKDDEKLVEVREL